MTRKPRYRLFLLLSIIPILLVLLAVIYQVVFGVFELGGVLAPAAFRVEVVRTDQGWNEKEWTQYYTLSQGTKIMPLSWFLALEQPILSPLEANPYASRSYLSRFGFLYASTDPPANSVDLPVGFAVEQGFVAPYATPPVNRPEPTIGLTCAACHTGRIDVKGADGRIRGMLIDGGSAMTSLGTFQDATGKALAYTLIFSERFERFAGRILGGKRPDGDPEKEAIRTSLQTVVSTGIASQNYAKDHKLNPVDSGFSRTDALGLIGNRVFGVMSQENQVVTDAPVNFPHIWESAWFDWVQYNASIRMPMDRNIGEALGVGAIVNIDYKKGKLYASTVNVENIHTIEDLLGGQDFFQGLQPPKWDESLLGPINRTLARNGEALYRANCIGCHLPPRAELLANLDNKDYAKYWATKGQDGIKQKILEVPFHDLNAIGTDPNQALNFDRRVAVVPKPKHWAREGSINTTRYETISAEEGLFRVTAMVRKDKYQALGLLALDGTPDPDAYNKDPARTALRLRYDRFRGLPDPLVFGDQTAILDDVAMAAVISSNLGYKARPLSGIWATPPFLHNGSVPNLDQILRPVLERSAEFYLGSRLYDTRRVGYETSQFSGAFKMDTSLSGNHNTGHEFRNLTLDELETALGSKWDGKSTREDRWAAALGVSRSTLDALTPPERWGRTRTVSSDVMKQASFRSIKGLLGTGFTEDERLAIVEYLKTL